MWQRYANTYATRPPAVTRTYRPRHLRAPSLGDHARASLRRGVCVFLGVCAATLWNHLATPTAVLVDRGEHDSDSTSLTQTDHAQQIRDLMDAHDCWDGAAAPEIPARAVVTLDAERGPRVVSADIGFKIWLDDAPGDLHGFCP